VLFLNSGTDRVLAIDRDGRVVRDSGRREGLNPGGGNFGPDGRYYVGLRSKRTVMAFSPRSTPPASISCRAGSYRFPAALLSAAMAGCSSPRVPGEQKYAVAIRDGDDLWLTMWVRCSPKGEVFILYPRAGREAGDPHASYHLNGIFHQKGHGKARLRQQRQALTESFKESEHLGIYLGHGKSSGAVCDPKAFDALVIVEPGILGPKHGSVGIDLVAPGYEAEWARDIAERFYFGTVRQREVLSRNPRPLW
jgi:hypothetical protein